MQLVVRHQEGEVGVLGLFHTQHKDALPSDSPHELGCLGYDLRIIMLSGLDINGASHASFTSQQTHWTTDAKPPKPEAFRGESRGMKVERPLTGSGWCRQW